MTNNNPDPFDPLAHREGQLRAKIVLHVPHDSTLIPAELADQFLIDRDELSRELIRMTDHLTRHLFAGDIVSERVVAPVSRLVVDVERFPDDNDEPMSFCGMGVIYQKTSTGQSLRRDLTITEMQALLDRYYWPHHARLESVVRKVLEECGHCLIIDAHSFPSKALPYETDQGRDRPDICIGTDQFHTSPALCSAFVEAFQAEGFRVAIDRPFSGAIVPAVFYQRESRVQSVMVEVNRDLYLDETTGQANSDFEVVSERVRHACWVACQNIAKETDK